VSSGRALYLDASTRWQVRLDAGVALNVSAPGRARSLYPLARLARVVSPAHADWAAAALLACLQAGVPVIFHDAHGDPVGWCFGTRRRETTLAALLREGLAEPDWDERFGAWHAAAERRAVREALRALGIVGGRPEAAAARAQLCNRHRQRLGMPVGEVLHALRLATAALAGECLQRELGEPCLIAHARPGLHLGLVLTGLLEWPTHRLLWQTRAHELKATAPARLAARMLEVHGADLQRALGDLLGSLELHLREWLG
jgi:hypothetical protein